MRILLIIGSLFAALSVLLGAFGAHALKNRLSIEDLAIFEIAVRYQMYHALGLLFMGVASFYLTEKLVSIPAYFMILGIIIFSGSLLPFSIHQFKMVWCDYSYWRFLLNYWMAITCI